MASVLAHHRVEAVDAARAAASEPTPWLHGWGLAATLTLSAGLVLAAVWSAGPARARTRTVLRLALGTLLLAGVLAACAGAESEPVVFTPGEGPADADPQVLFTSTGGDALAETIRSEGARDGSGTGLPDLVGFTGRNFDTREIEFAGQPMLVFSFDGIVGNNGTGPLDIFGNPQLSDPTDPNSHDVWQRTWDGTSWTKVGQPPIRYEAADGHNHFHLMELARYGLHDLDSEAMIAPAHKVGFCFLDSHPLAFWSGGKVFERAAQINDASPRPYAAFNRAESYCRAGSPHAEALHMGISPGWGDLYAETLALQWVDISNVPPGQYRLSSLMDPNGVIVESDEENNGPVFAEETMTVRGYNAAPVTAASVGEPVTIPLATTVVGKSLAAPQFTVVSEPVGGSLDVAIGEPFDAAEVVFTPEPGFEGIASFDVTARTSDSAWPANPTAATVSVVVGAAQPGPLTISGFRPTVDAGGGLDLDVHDPGSETEPGDVVWSVNGQPGGTDGVGSISASGFYQAPMAEGPVTITATLADGRAATVDLRVAFAVNNAPWIGEPVMYEGDGEIVSSDPASPARRLTPVKAGSAVAVLVPVVDLNGDQLIITAEGLPQGTAINITTGAITGTPTSAGDYAVVVTASDGSQDTRSEFTLTVSE